MRRFLDDHGYVEVETPMLTPKATGAAARPFKTHHNALDIDLYARIAPELYLKRLLVGGFEKVYELNRNFRNEGIDRVHNPEFTMLEFYWAYADVNQMMDFCEELIRATVFKVRGHTNVHYGAHDVDFSKPFARLTMKEAIVRNWPEALDSLGHDKFDSTWLDDAGRVERLVFFLRNIEVELAGRLDKLSAYDLSEDDLKTRIRELTWQLYKERKDQIWNRPRDFSQDSKRFQIDDSRTATQIVELFERLVENNISQPTFITDFPKPISPLSKASPSDPAIAERFELFMAGMECANGFSELNDPKEQYDRFNEQVRQRERGDEEAMVMDEDYIRALSYGMPPAAGIGIGIDRFVMLLTNQSSIRDVILFPHMRPERKPELSEAEEEEG